MRYFKRDIETTLVKELSHEEILCLLGLRQTGKTTLIKRLFQILEKDKKNPKSQIFYFDLEIQSVLERLNSFEAADLMLELKARGANLTQKIYCAIDEIQYLDSPSPLLKTIADHHKNIKLIVSGSSSLNIQKKFSDALTGRKMVFEIKPLSFKEFLQFRKEKEKETFKIPSVLPQVLEKDINPLELKPFVLLFSKYLKNYLLWGGFPKITLEETSERKKSLLNEIYTSYIKKDIKELAEIKNPSAFNNLIKYLNFQLGGLLNKSDAAANLKINRETVDNYLFLLEETFIIKMLKPFFSNLQKEIIKQPKIYFSDTGLINIIFNNFSPLSQRVNKGAFLENFVLNQLLKLGDYKINFWRTKAKTEVDFVLSKDRQVWPIEVKYKPAVACKKLTSGFKSFCEKYSPRKGIVVTRDFLGKKKYKKTTVYFIPVCLLIV